MNQSDDQGTLTSSDTQRVSDSAKARSYLERAEELMGKHVGKSALAHELAATAAAIGTGYAVLAQVEASWPSVDPAAAAFFRRAAQAAEESRPHDGELPEAEPAPPCGHSDDDCGLRGGSAHCGGCRG